jgi:hypothetical protein
MAKESLFKEPTLGTYVGAAGSIYSGVTSLFAADRTADDLEFQGSLALTEAFRTASIIREEGRNFEANQSLQFIGSGVELVGSALITLAQTRKYVKTEAEATEARGYAQANLAGRQASTKRSEGRAALVSGLIKAGTLFLA